MSSNIAIQELGELANHISSGSTPLGGRSVYLDEGPVMLIRSQNVRMNHLLLDDVAFVSDEIDSSMQRSRLEPQDVLLNITGASIGRVARFSSRSQRANVNQHVCIIRTKHDRLAPRYLEYFLSSPLVQNEIHNELQRGGTRQALTFKQISEFKIPLPSLVEQERIADILERANEVRRKRQQATAFTEQFLRSAFLDMFGNPVTNPKGWPVKKMEELASVDRGKFTPRPRNDPRYYGGDFPFIQTGDLAKCDGVLRTWTQTLNDEGVKVSREFPAGTVAISIAANIGDTAILGFDSYATDSVVGIQVDGLMATAEYIEYWFRFQQELLKQRAPETAQKNINLQVLRPLPVPIPKLALQEEFALQYRGFEARRMRFNEAASKLDDLFNSLVQRAFKGKL